MLEADHVFAGAEGVEGLGFALDLFLVVMGGFDGEADAALRFVHLDYAGFDLLADLQMILHLVDAIFADLRDVDEAVDVAFELDEGAKAGDLRDLAFDEIADLVLGLNGAPRIFLKLLETERDALGVLVDGRKRVARSLRISITWRR